MVTVPILWRIHIPDELPVDVGDWTLLAYDGFLGTSFAIKLDLSFIRAGHPWVTSIYQVRKELQ